MIIKKHILEPKTGFNIVLGGPVLAIVNYIGFLGQTRAVGFLGQTRAVDFLGQTRAFGFLGQTRAFSFLGLLAPLGCYATRRDCDFTLQTGHWGA